MHWGKGCASFLLPFYSEVFLSFCYNSYYVIFNTGKSLLEALIVASINRLVMNYHENYKCRTWAEQYLNNFEKPSHKVNCDIYIAMRTNLSNWCNLVSNSKNVMF